jgi:ATP-binding cassette, subfamily C, bacterial
MALLAKSSVGFMLHFLRAYPVRTGMMIGLLILSGIAEGVGLLTLLPLLDVAAGTGAAEQTGISATISGAIQSVGIEPTLGSMLLLIVGAMCLKGLFLWLALRQVGYTVAQVATDLRIQLIRALLRARWSYFAAYPTGHFTNAISTEAHRATLAYRHGCQSLAQAVQASIYAAVVFLVSWRIAVMALLVGGAMILALRSLVAMSRSAGNSQTELMKSLVARLTDTVPSIKPIKAMARERYLLPLLEDEAEAFNRAQRRQVLAIETLQTAREPMLVIAIATGLYLLLTFGTQPMSSILVLAILSYRLMQTVSHVQSTYQDMTIGESALWSMQSYITRAEEAREVSTGTRTPPPLDRAIRLEGVSFRYDETPVLSGVSVTFPARRFIALVGPSGSGKTTLVDLTLGLLTPTEGRVYVDDVPLDEIETESWRRMVGYVPQEVMLFHGSVYHNVTLGDRSITRTQVEDALRSAGAWDFVESLPHGMDEVVGERGSKLSGGQRQRIAIARALIGRPRLLILDEGTAALDHRTEAEICRTLSALAKEVTVITISHQTTMSDEADVVYRVSEGTVELERGDEATSNAVPGGGARSRSIAE